MNVVNAFRDFFLEAEDDRREDPPERRADNAPGPKLIGLMAGLGIIATSTAQEFVNRARVANAAKFTSNMSAFLLTCHPMDNSGKKMVCNGPLPQVPADDGYTSENILTGFSTFFQVVIMFVIILSVAKLFWPRAEPSSNSDVGMPSSRPVDNEGSHLLRDGQSINDYV